MEHLAHSISLTIDKGLLKACVTYRFMRITAFIEPGSIVS